MKIELNCAACGSNNFELSGVATDDAAVACADCGHIIGTMGQLKAKLADEVLTRARRAPNSFSAP